MTNEEGILRGIQEVLNAGYGDQATSPLDRLVAVNIINHLKRTGWMSPLETGIIVEAAGGMVVIPESLATGDIAFTLTSVYDRLNRAVVLSTKQNAVIPGEIVDDRPKIEHRTVESGPIKVTATRANDSAGQAKEE